MKKKLSKPWYKSLTINWGHVQNAAGTVIIVQDMFNQDTYPGLRPWVYGLVLILTGVITYWLRTLTKMPLGK